METIVRISIWISVVCWATGLSLGILGRKFRIARGFWTIGLLAFAIHVTTSFQAYYDWSFAVAYSETARQTQEMTGWDSGFGLWMNFLFGVVWLADAIAWWRRGHDSYRRRSPWITSTIHGFMAFIAFNGTVVFVEGPKRWVGIAVFAGLAAIFLNARIRRVQQVKR